MLAWGAALTGVILLGGFVLVVFVQVRFGAGEWYRTPADDLGPAERAWVAKEAADLLAELASCALVLAQKEELVEALLRDREAGVRIAVRRRLAKAGSREFRSEFAWASALVEENPAWVVRELPALRAALENSLEAYDEVLETLGVADGRGSVVERGKDHGNA